MRDIIGRRHFFKDAAAASLGATLGGIGLPLDSAGALFAALVSKVTPNAEKLGWQLACTAYSFNVFSFFKTVDLIAELGLDCVEGFSWQPLDSAKPQPQTNDKMSAADCSEAKKRLADKGVKLLGCYYNLPKGDTWRQVFDWAKQMGIEYLVAEPSFDDYETLDKLCQEYQLRLAIHNHAKPSPYWNPEVLLEHLRGHSPWMGACCDTGHWVRSGLDPVEMLKKLQGRVLTFHLKDVPAVGSAEADCVPFGTGKGNVAGILGEAKRQGFRGVFAIEYEPYGPESRAHVAECIAAFEKMAAALVP